MRKMFRSWPRLRRLTRVKEPADAWNTTGRLHEDWTGSHRSARGLFVITLNNVPHGGNLSAQVWPENWVMATKPTLERSCYHRGVGYSKREGKGQRQGESSLFSCKKGSGQWCWERSWQNVSLPRAGSLGKVLSGLEKARRRWKSCHPPL